MKIFAQKDHSVFESESESECKRLITKLVDYYSGRAHLIDGDKKGISWGKYSDDQMLSYDFKSLVNEYILPSLLEGLPVWPDSVDYPYLVFAMSDLVVINSKI